MTRNENKQEDAIRVDYDIPKTMFADEYSKTTLFLLPMIPLNIGSLMVRKFFVDSFIDDKGYEHDFIRPIFVLFAVKELTDPDWTNLYKGCLRHKDYVTDYECGIKDDKRLIMVVFTTDVKWKKDYYHFKAGRYSQFSDEYKKVIPKTINNRQGTLIVNIAFEVVHKAESLKRKLESEFMLKKGFFDKHDEIWDLPQREREYYRYDKSNNKVPVAIEAQE